MGIDSAMAHSSICFCVSVVDILFVACHVYTFDCFNNLLLGCIRLYQVDKQDNDPNTPAGLQQN